ncbi:hypothetical protein PybrP1_000342 [[Pythium] brassicae (nom. inval.)]|nr:hypothetical protein PybrP1_000342 [[Pythium] brassicae (nom. inval.)]
MADESSSSSADHQAAAAAAAAFHALQQQQQQQTPAAAAGADASTVAAAAAAAAVAAVASGVSGPYRGKCLYKTGKCPNERALKTSGAAHNLCDEHRRRQNEHQRKLDSKNRTTRREKRTRAGFLPDELDVDGATAGAAGDAVGELSKRGARGSIPARSMVASDAAAKAIASGTLADIAPVMMKALAAPSPAAAGYFPAPSPPSAAASGAPSADAKGVFLVGGAQPPQISPAAMQDFDGVVVPLPSYFEGAERVEFRARVYQKVLDFMSEECIRLFGGRVESGGGGGSAPAPTPEPHMRSVGLSALSAADAVHSGAYLTAHALQQQTAEKRSARVKQDDEAESESSDGAEEPRGAKRLRGSATRASRKPHARSEA